MAKGKFIDYRTIEGRFIKEMTKDCKTAVDAAIASNEFKNRTGNLQDSYGAALYKDGVLIRESIYYKTPIATTEKKWRGEMKSGHDEMIKYFESFKPRKMGITMVLVAAMPYGEVLERGGGNLNRKYKVIVGANSVMRELAAKYEGMFGRRRGARTSINVERINK